MVQQGGEIKFSGAKYESIVKRQGLQQPTVLHSPPQLKPPPTKGRLIQPNSLLRALTANVPSLSPKIEDLIALIQAENYVIWLNETWLDTQNRHLIEEVVIHGNKIFYVNKKTPTRRGG